MVKFWIVQQEGDNTEDFRQLMLKSPTGHVQNIAVDLFFVLLTFSNSMKTLEENVSLHPKSLTMLGSGEDVVIEVGQTIKTQDTVVGAFRALIKNTISPEELCEVLFDKVLST